MITDKILRVVAEFEKAMTVAKWPRETTTVLGEPRGRTQLRMSPDPTIEAAELDDLRFSKLVDVPPYHCGVVFERI